MLFPKNDGVLSILLSCRLSNAQSNEATSLKCFDPWELPFSKLCLCKNQLFFGPSSVFARPWQKTSTDACDAWSISTFLPGNLGRLGKRTRVDTAMYSTLFGFREKQLFIKKPNSFQKTCFLSFKTQDLLLSLLKKVIFGPIVWFKSTTCGLPNHGDNPHFI